MLPTALKDAMMNIGLYANESEGIDAFAEAWKTYFTDASSNGIPVLAAALTPAKSAMTAAMTGYKTAGATAIQAGIVAWWGSLVAVPASAFTAAILLVPPPAISGIGAALVSVFAANVSGGLGKDAARTAIAAALHGNNLGGMATFPGVPPIVAPVL
jgi:hypothetical protein